MKQIIFCGSLILFTIALPLAVFGNAVIKPIGAAALLLALVLMMIVVVRERLSR